MLEGTNKALLIIVVGLLQIASGSAQSGFEIDERPDAIVIEYNRAPGELAEKPKQPYMRVFGDGRLLVHIPPYMKNSGEFQMRLSRNQLFDLVGGLISQGIVDFDAAAVRSAKAEIAKSRPMLHATADADVTSLHLRLRSLSAANGVLVENLDRTVFWSGLKRDAALFPEIKPLAGFAAAEQKLLALGEKTVAANTPRK